MSGPPSLQQMGRKRASSRVLQLLFLPPLPFMTPTRYTSVLAHCYCPGRPVCLFGVIGRCQRDRGELSSPVQLFFCLPCSVPFLIQTNILYLLFTTCRKHAHLQPFSLCVAYQHIRLSLRENLCFSTKEIVLLAPI